MDNIDADRSNLSEAIRGLEMDVQRLEHELQDSEDKMRMIVQHPGDQDSLSGGGKFPMLMDKNQLFPSYGTKFPHAYFSVVKLAQ